MSTTSSELGVSKQAPAGLRLKKKKKRTIIRKAVTVTSVKITVNVPSESSTSENATTLENNVEKREENPRHSTTVREYLHLTIIPALLVGLHNLVRERPPDPLEFLAASLLKYKNEHADEDSIK